MAMATDATLSPSAARALEESLRAFARTFRAYQLYLPNNPMRAKSLKDARQAFAVLWSQVDEVTLTIAENAFLVDGNAIYQDDERGAAGLPWLLYRDGLRRLDLSRGFEESELEAFLDLLHRSKSAPPDEDDLVTLLWVADFTYLQYRNVELLIDFDAVFSAEDGAVDDGGSAQTAAQLMEAEMPGTGAAPEFVALEDFESSLHFLNPSEVAHLQEELRREYETDGRIGVIAALFDIVEGQHEVEAQVETCEIVDRLVVEALAERDYQLVALILREARTTVTRRDNLDAAVQNALASLPVRLSEADVITQLLDVVDTGENAPLTPLLDDLFAELRPWAMIPLLAWYGVAPTSPARLGVERAIVRIATRNTSDLVRLFEHQDSSVVRGAVLIARIVPTPPLVAPLTRLLAGTDAALRADSVAALAAIASPGALKVLEGAIDDEARDVRVGAVRAIGSHRYAAALPRLQTAMAKKQLRNADLSEKMAFFEAFGAVCGEAGVSTLDSVLNGRGLLGYRETPEMRACAAHALGLVNTRAATKALEKAADAPDVVVRSAVARALRASV